MKKFGWNVRGRSFSTLHDRIQIATAVNVRVITLDEAPRGHADFDDGVAKKFLIDQHDVLIDAGRKYATVDSSFGD